MTQPGADKGFEFGSQETEPLLGLSPGERREAHAAFGKDYAVRGLMALLVMYMSVTIIKLAVPARMRATT